MIPKEQFINQVNSKENIDELDKLYCGCGYIRHWIYSMVMGSWNPCLNEFDYQLQGIDTPEKLYDFLENKVK